MRLQHRFQSTMAALTGQRCHCFHLFAVGHSDIHITAKTHKYTVTVRLDSYTLSHHIEHGNAFMKKSDLLF